MRGFWILVGGFEAGGFVLVSLMDDRDVLGTSSVAITRKTESWSKFHDIGLTKVNCFRVPCPRQKLRANKESRSKYS